MIKWPVETASENLGGTGC